MLCVIAITVGSWWAGSLRLALSCFGSVRPRKEWRRGEAGPLRSQRSRVRHRIRHVGVALAGAPLLLLSACGQENPGASLSDGVPLQTVIRVCLRPMLDDAQFYDAEAAVQEIVIDTRRGTETTLISEIESFGGTTFYIRYGVEQSRIDEIADALGESTPEVERVVQVKIRPFEDSGPPDDVCGDRAEK